MMSLLSSHSNKQTFTWLHLSDLHVGMMDQDWLWPTLKHSLYTDLEELLRHIDTLDLVIFSGDLTQRGTPDEFERLSLILCELWRKLKNYGFAPQLIHLPGNHDVQRATSLSPELRVLRRWWDEPDIHREFFARDGSEYRGAITSLFQPYCEWDKNDPPGVEIYRGVPGLLPGDRSHLVRKDKRSLGIISLNSTWLQLDDSKYFAKLHVDPRQLLAITAEDPQTWCNNNDVNVLLTHHPIDWLHPNSQSIWKSDINPAGRFDIHLFGHNHQPLASSLATGGSRIVTSIQGASIFGLEYVEDSTERIHGYSLARLTISDSSRELRLWPRKLRTLASGDRKLGPDLDFDLDPDGSVKLMLNFRASTPALRRARPAGDNINSVSPSNLQSIAEESRSILDKILYHLPFVPAHANVRTIEQRKLAAALTTTRAAWIIADWGMGEDSFLGSAPSIKDTVFPVYRLDLSEYGSRAQFLDTIKNTLECSFQQLCELISECEGCLLILDNFPMSGSLVGSSDDITDFEDLVRLVLEYCPTLRIIVRSRRVPHPSSLPSVQLRPLDEGDLRTYVLDHDRGGSQLSSPTAIETLARYTDGIPTRIDRSLRDLEVTTLSELVNSNSDLTPTVIPPPDVSPALLKTLTDISRSKDVVQARSFSLLKVLSLFPQGEQLARIRRFYPTIPFHPPYATELLDQALIDVTTVQRLDVQDSSTYAKTLIVTRPVR